MLLSMSDGLGELLSVECKRIGSTKTGYIVDMLRSRLLKDFDVEPGVSKTIRYYKEPILNITKQLVDESAKKIEKITKPVKKLPKVCADHGGQLIGDKYSCCG